jgi:predicted nucleic acid binding AN1-type Zn finger protein
MEFANVGQHCTHEHCGQQDFLPFTCGACGGACVLAEDKRELILCCNGCIGVFCLEHRSVVAHSCVHKDDRDKRAHCCPLCDQLLRVNEGEGEDVNTITERHIMSRCKDFVKQPTLRGEMHTCSNPRCGKRDYVKMTCKHCGEHHCILHRMQEDHNCASLLLEAQSRAHVRHNGALRSREVTVRA